MQKGWAAFVAINRSLNLECVMAYKMQHMTLQAPDNPPSLARNLYCFLYPLEILGIRFNYTKMLCVMWEDLKTWIISQHLLITLNNQRCRKKKLLADQEASRRTDLWTSMFSLKLYNPLNDLTKNQNCCLCLHYWVLLPKKKEVCLYISWIAQTNKADHMGKSQNRIATTAWTET